MKLFSPAKINLFLRILRKRPDGYHDLASLFQAITLGDFLTFHLASGDSFTCTDSSLPTDSSNLVCRALTLFRQKTALTTPIAITLEKKIPQGAGLGGGSSNGATTLWALNALHGFPASEKELQTWSAEIGSDLPFFFSCGTAYCTGRGEEVRDLPPIPHFPRLEIIFPGQGLSTPAVYKALQLSECSTEEPEKILEGFYKGNPRFINDLQRPACRLFPALENYLQERGHRFMTGSGTGIVYLGGGELSALRRSPREWY